MKPKCHLELEGPEGNAFAIIAKVKRTLTTFGYQEQAKEFMSKAFSCGSYQELLDLCGNYVETGLPEAKATT